MFRIFINAKHIDNAVREPPKIISAQVRAELSENFKCEVSLKLRGVFEVCMYQVTTNYQKRFRTPHLVGLVLGYIDASDSESRLLFLHCWRSSTRFKVVCSSPSSLLLLFQNIVKTFVSCRKFRQKKFMSSFKSNFMNVIELPRELCCTFASTCNLPVDTGAPECPSFGKLIPGELRRLGGIPQLKQCT